MSPLRYSQPSCTLEVLPQPPAKGKSPELQFQLYFVETGLTLSGNRAELDSLRSIVDAEVQHKLTDAYPLPLTSVLELGEHTPTLKLSLRQLADLAANLDLYGAELAAARPRGPLAGVARAWRWIPLWSKTVALMLLTAVLTALAMRSFWSAPLTASAPAGEATPLPPLPSPEVASPGPAATLPPAPTPTGVAQLPPVPLPAGPPALENLPPPPPPPPPGGLAPPPPLPDEPPPRQIETRLTTRVPESAGPPASRSEGGAAAPEAAAGPSRSGEVRAYFRSQWSPPESLKTSLEYRLVLGPDGALQSIRPLGRESGLYLDRTGMPLVGESFVSASGGSESLILVLGPDGSVRVAR